MSFKVEELGKSMVKLTIEVAAEEFEKAMETAYQKNKNKLSVQGFRKGKAPRAMIEKMYGAGIFYEDAANELIPDAYEKAAVESGLDIVSRPEIDLVQVEKGKEFIFTAEVAVKPEVTLGTYKGVEVEKTLTGFKFIGDKIHAHNTGDKKKFVFGYEESYGCLIGDFVRDKDAVQASLMLCESAAYYRLQGKTLIDVLNDLYAEHGYFLDALDNFTFKGIDGSDKIAALITSVLPTRITDVIKKFRNSTLSVIKKYISSYLLILLMTYAIMLTGLWILRVEHVWVIALLIAVLDILPVLGVGTVLIPWSIFSFAEGNRALGIGLILLFVANAIIRQLAEPKIVGKSLNLHPIITLMMIYVGLSLFGIFGAIILPVIAVSIGVILKRDDSAEVT